MDKAASMGREVSLSKKEWDLLSFFLQNARTACARLGSELEGKGGALQEYARLFRSLSLDHAWQVAKLYAERGSADRREVQKLLVGIQGFLMGSGRVILLGERSEVRREVEALRRDLEEVNLEEARLHSVAVKVEQQWRKVVSWVAGNLGSYKGELSEHLDLLQGMIRRFDQDFPRSLEEAGAEGEVSWGLRDFLTTVQGRLVRLGEERLVREWGLGV